MITLTYDDFVYDERGNIIGENLNLRSVDVRDCQLFIKRLRKHFKNDKIKYILAAEYGKTTHRPHYHAVLFGVCFDDLIYHKKSDRGNIIYRSPTLQKLWKHGICTVDSINITAKVARYCTKYCVKDFRTDDTFMLFSHGIGEAGLLRDFNGKSYVVDGREYPVPKQIWQKAIISKYVEYGYSMTIRYIQPNGDNFDIADQNRRERANFRLVRDLDPQYNDYLLYWQRKTELYERTLPDVVTRILQLPDNKYFFYKQASLRVYSRMKKFLPWIPPRSRRFSEVLAYYRDHNLPIPKSFAVDHLSLYGK